MEPVVTAAIISAIAAILAAIILALSSLGKQRDSSPIATTAARLDRKEYNDRLIRAIDSNPTRLRAIIVGPLFLHPHWVIKRRLKRERRKSFSQALRHYLENSVRKGDRDIRLILRNSDHYYEILRPDVKDSEVHRLIQEMKSSLHELMSDGRKNPTISFICEETGHYHGVVITDSSCFVYGRKGDDSKIEWGEEHKDPEFIRNELTRFEQLFDNRFKDQAKEIQTVERFIDSLAWRLGVD